MKWKKVTAIMLAAVTLTGMFSGCGSSKSGESTDTGDSSEPVVLQWWGSFPEDQGPNQVCEAFNAIDPNVQVEYTRFVNDDSGNTKLDVSLMSDSSIDIFTSLNDVWLKKRIDSGYCYALDELFEDAGFDINEYYDDTISQREIDGHYYSLPAKKMTYTILYNKDMFDEAGVPYPEPDWTYDEFLETAKALTKGEGNDKVYGYMYPGYDAGQPATIMQVGFQGQNWMYGEDGSAQIDTDIVKDVTEKYLERVEEGIEPSYVDITTQNMDVANMFLTEKAAMIFGDWVVRDVKDTDTYPHDFVTGFANMPRLSEDQEANYTTSYTDDMSINSKSEHVKEAMDFIIWYIEEGMDYVAPFSRIPACTKYTQDELESLIFGDKEELFDMDSARSVYLTGTDFSTRSEFAAAQEINTILTEEFEKAFAGEQSVDETLSKAQERADEALEKAQ